MTDWEARLRAVPWIVNAPKHGFNQCDRSSYECPDHLIPDYAAMAALVEEAVKRAGLDEAMSETREARLRAMAEEVAWALDRLMVTPAKGETYVTRARKIVEPFLEKAMKQAGLEEAAKHADCCVDREERDAQAQEIARLRAALDHADQWFMQMANQGTLDATVGLRKHIAAALAPAREPTT